MAEQQQYEIRNKQMLIVAAVLGAVAVILVMVNEYRIRNENEEDLVSVVIARVNLPAGHRLDVDRDTEISRIPQRLLPKEFANDIVGVSDKLAVDNLEVNQDVSTNRILRFAYFRGGAAKAGNAMVPKEGYFIIPIKVDRNTCPPGLVPGMWVDVELLGPKTATPVIQRVLVKTLNGLSTVAGGTIRNVEAVGVEVRKEDAAKLAPFLKAFQDQIVLWTRNADQATDAGLNVFNPELDKTTTIPGPVAPAGGGPSGPNGTPG
jgi:Flp pilus assembly protein CpaB